MIRAAKSLVFGGTQALKEGGVKVSTDGRGRWVDDRTSLAVFEIRVHLHECI